MELDAVITRLEDLPSRWDGRTSILEMKSVDYNWRQTEWAGFYFQLLCKRNLSDIMKIPGRRFNNGVTQGDFDASYQGIDWDMKTHTATDAKGIDKPVIPLNDAMTIDQSLAENDHLYMLVAMGTAVYDDASLTFKSWHDELKGGLSAYSKERIARGATSRRLKQAFQVNSFNIYKIDSTVAPLLTIFRQGRNSNGKPRPEKYNLDTSRVKPVAKVIPKK